MLWNRCPSKDTLFSPKCYIFKLSQNYLWILSNYFYVPFDLLKFLCWIMTTYEVVFYMFSEFSEKKHCLDASKYLKLKVFWTRISYLGKGRAVSFGLLNSLLWALWSKRLFPVIAEGGRFQWLLLWYEDFVVRVVSVI